MNVPFIQRLRAMEVTLGIVSLFKSDLLKDPIVFDRENPDVCARIRELL